MTGPSEFNASENRGHPYDGLIDEIQPADPTRPEPDRATYLAGRLAERERIRVLDAAYREQMSWVAPLLKEKEQAEIYINTEYEDFQAKEVRERSLQDHHNSLRRLSHVVEDYLLGFPEYPWETGQELVKQATTTDELIASLLRLEDQMIQMFGPPWKD
jgi:hypothetical protein